MRDIPGLPGPVSRPRRNSWGEILRGEKTTPRGVAGLTLLELATVRRYLAGQTPAEIAAAMGTTRERVNPRIDQIRRKLGLGSRAELRAWLAEHADEVGRPG